MGSPKGVNYLLSSQLGDDPSVRRNKESHIFNIGTTLPEIKYDVGIKAVRNFKAAFQNFRRLKLSTHF